MEDLFGAYRKKKDGTDCKGTIFFFFFHPIVSLGAWDFFLALLLIARTEEDYACLGLSAEGP
jgi:hypothetical protein